MRPQVALLALLAALLAGASATTGCGGDDDGSQPSAAALIDQTFGAERPIQRGRMTLQAKGESEGSGAFDVKLSAAFDQAERGQLPKLDGTLDLRSASGTLRAGAISTGDKGYVVVSGQAFEVPAGDFAAFTKRYLADQRASSSSRSRVPSLSSLGVHPAQWLRNPRVTGDSTVGSAETTHVVADVDLPKLTADVRKIVERNGLSKQLSSADLDQLSASVKSAKVDLDTGREDHRLRRLAIHLELASGAVDLTLRYDDLDEPQSIEAPKDARPLAELTSALRSLTGGGSSGSSGSSATDRYQECLQQAGTDLAKVQDCAKYL